MPIIEIICLANSRKHSGRCVAGVRTDGKGWIRPVSVAPEGVLHERHYTLEDTSEAQIMDVIRIPFDKPRPLPHHPEDWLIRPETWELSTRHTTEAHIALLKSSLTLGPALLGNTEDRLVYPSTVGGEISADSLALVQPENLHFVVKARKTGEKQVRVMFDLAGAPYNLAITDTEWEPRLKSQEIGTYTLADFGIPTSETPLLTISLSEPLLSEIAGENRCYKLVAALFLAPAGWNQEAYTEEPNPSEAPAPPPAKRATKRKAEEPIPEPAETPEPLIRVAVAGAAGRMGREVVRAVLEAEGMTLALAVDHQNVGADAGELAGYGRANVPILEDLASALKVIAVDVLVDFTLPDSVFDNLKVAIENGVSPVVGTTGLSQEQLAEIDSLAKAKGIGAFIAPNFAIGAVFLMEFAAQAAKYMPDVEIIELHHEKKLDSPSGTALLTAQKIAEARVNPPTPLPANTVAKIEGARGASFSDIPIHSVRLQGFVASQEVIFGGLGQTLTLRHDSLDRRSFMPGVVLSVRKVRTLIGLTVGLEKLMF